MKLLVLTVQLFEIANFEPKIERLTFVQPQIAHILKIPVSGFSKLSDILSPMQRAYIQNANFMPIKSNKIIQFVNKIGLTVKIKKLVNIMK